jgi:hypothetical protein
MWDMFFLKLMTRRWKSYGLLVVVLISVGAAGCGERLVDAPPAKVAFESSLFRILDVNIPAGTTLQHSYPNGVAMVVMTNGAGIRMRPPGKDWGNEMTPGVGTVTIGEPGEHAVQNVGQAAFQLLALENLRPGGSTGQPLAGKGMNSIGESASLRVYDAQLTDNNTQVSHVHASPAVTILVQGKVLSQGPENKDKAIGEVVSGLKQLDAPGQWVFVPAGEAHYVVRLGVAPTHVVEVELR